MTDYAGIDYGRGRTNIGTKGIRYGVIPFNKVSQAWCEESEPYYGDPICPSCSEKLVHIEDSLLEDEEIEFPDYGVVDFVCEECHKAYSSDEVYPENPVWYIDDNEYSAEQDDYGDIFILRSPYYTYAQFCSPCAPGAVYLTAPLDHKNDNNQGYCFGPEWFEEEIHYDIYSVKTNELIAKKGEKNG